MMIYLRKYLLRQIVYSLLALFALDMIVWAGEIITDNWEHQGLLLRIEITLATLIGALAVILEHRQDLKFSKDDAK